jgi:hypothetical protein
MGREVVEEKSWFPSFGPQDFEPCFEHARYALYLAEKAVKEQPDSPQAQRDLAYAQAAAIRFREGSAQHPARYQAEMDYGHSLRDSGAPPLVGVM